jgi:GntR family transcriptional regulator/MocR family aminotransferase
MKKVASGIVPRIAVDRKAPKALHRQIYDAYRAAIADGSLRPTQQIPSTRVLASELGVSRFPVLNAYAQLLAEGYIESRVGAGTLVSSSLPDQLSSSESIRVRTVANRSGPRRLAHHPSHILGPRRLPWLEVRGALGVGQVAVDHFPLHIWSRLIARRSRNMDSPSFNYGNVMGSPALREAIASYLRTARSVRCEAEQVMIVSGSQQALQISGIVLLDRESFVWVEEPGYRLAGDAFGLTGCHLVPVPVDQEGMEVAVGIKRCHKARAAFVTPSHQFPIGVTMSASRRFQLLDWAQNTGSWIIEDDYDSEYRYESSPIACLQGLDANARVIYIGTFSKVLFPSLRLGYIVIPSDLVDRFLSIRRAVDLGPQTLEQQVLADFINEGHFARHIRRSRILYRERRRVLVDNIGRQLGAVVEVLGDEAGMHLTVALPTGSRDVEIAAQAAGQNLWIWPLSPLYRGQPSRPGLVIGFGSTAAEKIPGAIRKLRDLLRAK